MSKCTQDKFTLNDIDMCTCTHTHAYAYACTCMCTHKHTHTCTHVQAHAQTHFQYNYILFYYSISALQCPALKVYSNMCCSLRTTLVNTHGSCCYHCLECKHCLVSHTLVLGEVIKINYHTKLLQCVYVCTQRTSELGLSDHP